MPTWAEIQDYARSKYKLSRDEDNSFALIWAYDNNRTQQIFVRRFEAFDEDFIEFRTPVCKEPEMSHTVALRKNAQFVVGALALEDGHIFMMHNAPLRTMDIDEFEMPLHVLARTADKLEEEYSSGSDDF
jgi:hypothetical protein